MGRPKKFKTVEELQELINTYFDSCFEIDAKTGVTYQSRPFTVSGLAYALGTSRQTLMRYEKEFTEYSDTILLAKARIEQYAEEQLFKLRNPNGAIFALKNNWRGWEDSTTSKLIGDKEQDAIQLEHQVQFYIPDNKRDSQD